MAVPGHASVASVSVVQSPGGHASGSTEPRIPPRVGRLLVDGRVPAVTQVLIPALVGEGPAAELSAFLAMADELPDIDALLQDEGRVRLPQQADRQYAISQAVVHRLQRHPEPGSLAERVLRIACALHADLAALFMTDVLAVLAPDQAAALVAHPRWGRWSAGHGRALRNPSRGAA